MDDLLMTSVLYGCYVEEKKERATGEGVKHVWLPQMTDFCNLCKQSSFLAHLCGCKVEHWTHTERQGLQICTYFLLLAVLM